MRVRECKKREKYEAEAMSLMENIQLYDELMAAIEYATSHPKTGAIRHAVGGVLEYNKNLVEYLSARMAIALQVGAQ